MVNAVGVFVRYDMPNEQGHTRRQRNQSLNLSSPEFSIHPAGERLWKIFIYLTNNYTRIKDGICERIPLSEVNRFDKIFGYGLNVYEYDILLAMDSRYCHEVNKELSAMRKKAEKK